LTAVPVTAEGGRGRAGAQTLSLLAIPFNASLITDLADGPRSLVDLRRQAGSPPQTTMRGHLRTLIGAGIVERHRQSQFPNAVDYRLTPAGHELLAVTEVLDAWLAASPEGPTSLGGRAARSTIKALVEAWTTGMVRVLSSRPLSLTELSRVIGSTSYPSLERRLSSMRLLGMVEAMPGSRRSTPYAVTDWLRGAVAPLAAAVRWERRRMREAAPPITNRDVEATFLLPLPLLRMPEDVSGTCRLAVQMNGSARTGTAGAIASVREGAVAPTGTRLENSTDAWAHGPAGAWLAAIVERDIAGLELGGETGLATSIIDGLHGELFARIIRGMGRELSASAPVSTP
jgi:DNA-binding HxlR family transcriptional regulator